MGRLDYHQQWQGTKVPSIFFNHNSLGHVMVLPASSLAFYCRLVLVRGLR
jgi:hypothetical protein